MPVFGMQVTDRGQCIDSFLSGFTNADQDSRRKRNFEFARSADRREPQLRRLIRGSIVNAAGLAQALRCAFQHQALRDGYPAQLRHLGCGHDAWIDMRHEHGFAQHQFAHRGKVIDRRRITQRIERLARGTISKLGLVTQGKEHLGATCHLGRTRDRKNLIRSQIGRSDGTRGLCKHAVMADVPAELRQRDKHLSRVVNQIPVAFVAQGRSAAQQLRQRQIRQRCRRPNPVKFD